MRKLWVLSGFVILFSISAFSRSDSLTLLLIHPTEKNVSSFRSLLNEKIIPISVPYKIIGVYHKNEIYDYNKTADYLKINAIKNVILYCINGSISQDSIFYKNQMHNDFISLINASDGAVFTGGPDLPPYIYNEKTLLNTLIEDPYRHFMEISFLAHLLGTSRNKAVQPLILKKPKYAVLGICLGMQSMNVAAGGTLIQDIPSQLYQINSVEEVLLLPEAKIHVNYHEKLLPTGEIFWGTMHPIVFVGSNTNFNNYLKHQINVVSAHHQCVGQLAEDYETIAFSTDLKVPEIIVHKQFPHVLGVQFHPELLAIYDDKLHLKFKLNADSIIFSEEYAGKKGLLFHYDLWKMFATMLEQSCKTRNN